MPIALLADIHANREALSACLADARARGVERFAFLGDFVGYGADPCWVVDTVMAEVDRGAVAILGNHDHAVADLAERMNPAALLAIEWTRNQLGSTARAFLSRLPTKAEQDGRVYIHAGGPAPKAWRYVADRDDAVRCFDEHAGTWIFCGHVHVPALFGVTATGKITHLKPTTGVLLPLMRQRRWLAVLGSVGQPRDGNPSASYAIFDDRRDELTFCRVAYDIDRAAQKIRAAGLPPALADRLLVGH